MRAVEIKTELKNMIENETDLAVLEAVKTLLQRTQSSTILKEKLSSRAFKAQSDIEEGRVFDRTEMNKRLNDRFGI